MIFLDCEFTNFARPKLLSIGLVTDDGHEFYGELDLADPHSAEVISDATQFVHEVVFSQWNTVQGAAMTYATMALEMNGWLTERSGRLEICYDSSVGFNLFEALLSHHAPASSLNFVPQHIGYLAQDADGCAAAEASWSQSENKDGLMRHHALADARSLMARFQAVHGWP